MKGNKIRIKIVPLFPWPLPIPSLFAKLATKTLTCVFSDPKTV